MTKKYQYDVALSFAGEDRDYVEQVAKVLEANGIKVHYDRFNQVQVWGRNLAEHFDDIYRNQAQYCVMFISENYAKKVWPSFEKRSALSREVIESGYILPARFDDTDILGIPPSKAYIDINQYNPKQFAQLVMEKLGKTLISQPIQNSQSFRRPKIAKSFDPYKESQIWINYLTTELEKRCESSEMSFSSFSRDGKECLRFVINGKPVYSINIQLGAFSRDHGLSLSYAHGEMSAISAGFNAFGEFEWDKDRECVILKLNDFSVYARPTNERQGFIQHEFLDYIWEKVCNATEGKY